MKRIRITLAGGLIAAAGCALGAGSPVAAQTADNVVAVRDGTARCTSPLDGTWTAGWLVDASSPTPDNTWVLTSPDGDVEASPTSASTTLVSGFLQVVTTADSISVEWTATFTIGNDVSGATPVVNRPTESCDPPPPTDGFEYTLACTQFEGARFLVVNWQEGTATGSESIPLASGTFDADSGQFIGGQYPPDQVDVSVTTPTGALSFPVTIPDDELCGPRRTETTTTTTTTTSTTTSTTTTVAGTTTTLAVTTTSVDGGAQTPTTTTVSPTLPQTGNDLTDRLAIWAVILVGLGTAAVVAARRRTA